MLRLIEGRGEIATCQRKLERSLRASLPDRAHRNIGYPSDTLYDAAVRTDGAHWYHTRDQRDEGNPRRLNWFGLFSEGGNLQISVEINVPFEGRNDQIAGFFVRERRGGQTFLAHSGRVGGGTAGVGKTGFLAWSEQRLIEAEDDRGATREGILVAPLDIAGRGAENLFCYVDSIARYKAAVRAGETATPAFRRKAQQYADYYEESRGRRRGMRRSEIDYFTRHGDVVSALYAWRGARPNPQGARVVKDILIDLGMAVGRELTELYEAKSSADRTSIYTAIGQLFVHARAANCRRFIVLPENDDLPDGISEALARLKIGVLRFRFKTKGAVIVG